MTDAIIIAVDPGVASGIVKYDPIVPYVVKAFQADQFETCQFLDEELSSGRPRVLVIERFIITAATLRKTRQNASIEIIGVGRYLAEYYKREFIEQAPADAKRFITNSKLRTLGWWDASDHVRDAYRHLGLYLAKQGYESILKAT